ncbi:MAG: 2-amino-4-hydroxy-6-hydroxymethyldihydropteridine diphosphokinase [Prevotellaceae bacterium]|jgi:2-amino-4-hydroxy-6-hydroxymethyldihydropteridine diphosphokinase|nr:2-amino-4-hydroxy-6-hydroxymethyldihydropteridine diphosphokinase [Prevotellaceae bacterium]
MKLVLALGSNLGDRDANLNNAIRLINSKIGSADKISGFYRTEPVGFVSDNYFLNSVVLVNTKLSVYQAFKATQKIEKILGRTTKSINGVHFDRIIDIDLLFYGNKILKTKNLTLPHPRLHLRNFVLDPLNEILPNFCKYLRMPS